MRALPDPFPEPKLGGSGLFLLLLALVLCTFFMRATQLSRLTINWDEFHYLAHLYDYLRGTLTYPWASFHVHFFGWLPHIPGHEVSQILAARSVLLLLGLLTATHIFWIARRFIADEGALFAVLCYQSLAYVMAHGSSFRPDPMTTFLFVFAVHHLLSTKHSKGRAMLAAVAMAVALMLSIKSLIHLSVVVATAGAVLVAAKFSRDELARWAIFAATFTVTFAGFYVGHRASLSLATGEAEPAAGFLSSIVNKLFQLGDWFPRREYLRRSFNDNPIVWAMLPAGAVISLVRLVRGRPGPRLHAVLPLIFAAPLLSLAVYRNAFPYFYPFILPLAVVLCGVVFSWVREHTGGRLSKFGYLLVVVMIVGVFSGSLSRLGIPRKNQVIEQRQVLEVIHLMFPEPVPYLDRCSMVSSFPQVGFFMSRWGMEKYRSGVTRSLTASVREDQPVFILANNQMLNLRHSKEKAMGFTRPLLSDDLDLLSQTYIEHWGRIFVAGRHIVISNPEVSSAVTINIAGPYTVEALAPVWIGNRQVEPGGIVELDIGSHQLRATSPGIVTLRWGRRLYRPMEEPLTKRLFKGFG